MRTSICTTSVTFLVVAGFFGLGAEDAVPAETSRAEVVIERTTTRSQYVWILDKCRIGLILWQPGTLQARESGRIGVRRGELCKKTQSYLRQLTIIGELLDRVIAEEPLLLQSATTLAWGGFVFPEEIERLVNAYLLLPQRPAHSCDDNCIVFEALARSTAFVELEEVFRARGLELSLKTVEGVHRMKARELSRLGIDRSKLVRCVPEESAVPTTAMVWFKISPVSTERSSG